MNTAALLLLASLLLGQHTPHPPGAAAPAQPAASAEPGESRKGDEGKKDGGKKDDGKEKEEKPADRLAVTKHSVGAAGGPIAYTTTAGYITLAEESGKDRARIFHVAYVKDGVDDPSKRPVTFVFNGGPGSSSVWLHLGAVGPRRVLMGDAGAILPPPYRLADNEHTWLQESDLVFIDPVGTGYSRPAEGREQKEFSGLTQDIESVGEFIRLWTTRSKRWSSPKFLAGESYGTTRAAGLAGHLQDRHGMYLSGIMLISPVLHFGTIRFDDGNDMPYALYAPTYAATAWFHRRLAPDLQGRDVGDLLGEVERWSMAEYLPALALGDALPEARRAEVERALARYTGLPESYVRSANMRIGIGRFAKQLLRDQRRTVGRLDSRFTGIDSDAAGESFEHDPSMAAILGPYTAALNQYVRVELEYENDLPYEILTGRVQPWSYAGNENRYVNVGETLREAMSKNAALRVLVACGRYDMATPQFAARYTVDHLGLEPALRPNISLAFYDAGHMMYVHGESLRRLHEDAAALIRAATAGR